MCSTTVITVVIKKQIGIFVIGNTVWANHFIKIFYSVLSELCPNVNTKYCDLLIKSSHKKVFYIKVHGIGPQRKLKCEFNYPLVFRRLRPYSTTLYIIIACFVYFLFESWGYNHDKQVNILSLL